LAIEFRKGNVVVRDSHDVRSWGWDRWHRICFDDGNSHTFASTLHSQPADKTKYVRNSIQSVSCRMHNQSQIAVGGDLEAGSGVKR
jgi:hypothetical protein